MAFRFAFLGANARTVVQVEKAEVVRNQARVIQRFRGRKLRIFDGGKDKELDFEYATSTRSVFDVNESTTRGNFALCTWAWSQEFLRGKHVPRQESSATIVFWVFFPRRPLLRGMTPSQFNIT